LLERVASEALSDLLHRKYGDSGVQILSGTAPTSLQGDGSVTAATLDNDKVLQTDLVVMGVGVELNTSLAREAGLEMWQQNAVKVDEMLRTSDPDIYAAGDIAAWPDPTFGKRLRVEHWDVAWNQGMRAGRNMAGEHKPYQILPYFFSDLFDLSFEVWGDLAAWDQTVLRGSLEEGSYAFYYFDHGQVVGVLAVNRPDAERAPMTELVKMRPAYDGVRSQLSDEATDLSKLVE
jgi:NADPH-dependent 2,4-dienoyl-CoA reductase/sulfur reductase-like enzyme